MYLDLLCLPAGLSWIFPANQCAGSEGKLDMPELLYFPDMVGGRMWRTEVGGLMSIGTAGNAI